MQLVLPVQNRPGAYLASHFFCHKLLETHLLCETLPLEEFESERLG